MNKHAHVPQLILSRTAPYKPELSNSSANAIQTTSAKA
jgi:hypothetical protein